MEYAKLLKNIADTIKDKILIVMRVYFEKPRTTIGWKGLINDPLLNDSYNVNKGLYLAKTVARRHRIVERFLSEVLKLPKLSFPLL